jgi:hypothetical protein
MSLLRDVIWELQLPDAMDPGIHGARTHWIRGFMAFQPHRRIRDRDADGADVT